MYANYVKIAGVNEAEVKTSAQAEELMLAMLRFFGALWYWDPTYEDPMVDRRCELFKVSRDQVIRLVIDLCLSQHRDVYMCHGNMAN